MKYIKIILVFASIMILIYLLHFITSLFIHNMYQYVDPNSFQKYGYFISFAIELIMFIALIFMVIELFKVIKNGDFNLSSAKPLRFGGILFILVGILDIIYCVSSSIIDNNPEIWMQRVFTDFLLMTLGIIGLIVLDVIKKGALLKTENDLTI